MTWGSFLTRVLSLTLVLPLILSRFDVAETALWYLFSSIIGMQFILDMGFGVTFARVIAYAYAGSDKVDHTADPVTIGQGTPNWGRMGKVVSTMRGIYMRLSPLYVTLLATLGTLALVHSVLKVPNPQEAWIAWLIIIAVNGLVFFGNMYGNYLQGLNKIALFRRWEAISSLGAILTSFLVLVYMPSLLNLVIAHQSWAIINVLRNRYFARRVEEGRFTSISRLGIDRLTLSEIWPAAWRSGLGIGMSQGVVQLSGIIYSQFGATANVAAYFLAMRLMQAIRGFSMGPFYSRLYLIAQLRAKGDTEQQIAQSKRGMRLSYWTFVISFIAIGLWADSVLAAIGSNTAFVSPAFWSVLGLAYFLERYGAMHLQLYTSAGRVIWHIANGVSGTIYLVALLVLFGPLDYFAIPVAYLISIGGFYSWYSASRSYRLYNLNLWRFERTVSVPALLAMAIYIYLAGTTW